MATTRARWTTSTACSSRPSSIAARYRIEVRKPGFGPLRFDVRVQPDARSPSAGTAADSVTAGVELSGTVSTDAQRASRRRASLALYDLTVGVALRSSAPRAAGTAFGVAPPHPPIHADLTPFRDCRRRSGYLLPYRDPVRYRGYLWIFGVAAQKARAPSVFVSTTCCARSPPSFLLFAASDGVARAVRCSRSPATPHRDRVRPAVMTDARRHRRRHRSSGNAA